MADKKISELTAITGADTAADDFFIVVDTSGSATKKISRAELNNAIEQDVLSSIEITDITNDVNIEGTVTADGLTVDGVFRVDAASPAVNLVETDVTDLNTRIRNTVGDFRLETINDALSSVTRRLQVDHSTGDISFYDNTGVTQGFFWDASTQRLGLGTTSPAAQFHSLGASGTVQTRTSVTGSTASDVAEVAVATGSRTYLMQSKGSTGSFVLRDSTGAADRLTITSGGNVGIGTTSPAGLMHLYQSSGYTPIILDGSGGGNVKFYRSGSQHAEIISDGVGGNILFRNNTNNERMRIDSSGNLLVGTTSTTASTTGFKYRNDLDRLIVVADGGTSAQFGRLSSDGDVLSIQKDGTTVGVIGADAGDLVIGTGIAGLRFLDSSSAVIPRNSDGTQQDNVLDFGSTNHRWVDIYATNATIQTSDANEKQDIEELTDAEQRVAVAAKGLLRKYRWKSSVEEKGDDARIHFGIIAQDLKAAFEAEGLDAGRYAMFINTEWTDEETGEQKSRMGIRYNQLLAFIIAAI